MTDRSRRVKQLICKQKDNFIAELRTLVEMESPSTDPESNIPVFEYLAKKLEDIDFRINHIPGRQTGGQLIAVPENRDKSKPIQLLLGHCDTVWPLGSLEEMPCQIKNGTMYGPGIYDMKAGLMEILTALETIRKLNETWSLTPVVFISSDEEIGSNESKININRLAKIANRSFVLEPSLGFDAKIKTSRKGVGNYDVTVRGVSAHSGLEPERGSNAILEMTNIIQKLYDLNNPDEGISINVGTIEGGERTNVVASSSKISVDVRVVTNEQAEYINQTILHLKPTNKNTKIEVEGGIDRPPMQKNPDNTALWKMAKKLGNDLGLELEDGRSGGASDGNFTSQYCPTLDGLGAVGDGAHALHEQIKIDDTLQRAALLTQLILAPPVNR